MKPKNNLKHNSEDSNLINTSTQFLSLSGLAGVLAGIYALIGGFVAYTLLNGYGQGYGSIGDVLPVGILELVLLGIALFVGALAVGTSYFLTKRKAKKNKEKLRFTTSRHLLSALFLPIISGGFFVLLIIYRGYYGLVVPAALIFYGLGLVSASRYSLNQVKYLGVLEIILGITAMIYFGQGIIFWMLGFGVLHIIYAGLMYFKSIKQNSTIIKN